MEVDGEYSSGEISDQFRVLIVGELVAGEKKVSPHPTISVLQL